MAKAIAQRPSTGPAESTLADLAGELEASRESIREMLELIRLLDERGLLRFSTDLLREEDRVLEVVASRFPPAEVRRAVRNLEVLVQTLRDVDPSTLQALARGIPAGLDEARRAEPDRTIGILAILSALKDPEVNRGVRMILGFLKGVGRASA
jgi:uncharacterized protein YjgD (DUF1641 family)